MLERLEDRLTPSTVTENAADAATLQTDLNNATAANTQYIINLTGASSAYTLTAGTELTVSAAASGSSVTIAGTGQSITGNGNRVFLIDEGANVTVQNVTITGGAVTATSDGYAQGGGILDRGGNVTLSKVNVLGNRATGIFAEGGGIFVSGDGNLTIKSSSVIGFNQAISESVHSGSYDSGGGLYVSGNSTVAILDSTLDNNVAQGAQGTNATVAGANGGYGGDGGSASGGGLYVSGIGWTVKLIGDTFSGNAALGGNGGNGADGINATGTNAPGGNGGWGGGGGSASGGAAFFSSAADGSLTILNDPAAPTTHPSLFVDNAAQAGSGGNGGVGGFSTGTASNSFGGNGGSAGSAGGGALVAGSYSPPPPEAFPIDSDYYSPFTVNIGNTSFYGNKVFSSNGGMFGDAGSGGSGEPGRDGQGGSSGGAFGGGLDLGFANTTLVNCTVAGNIVTAVAGQADGGGIYGGGTLDNNTITQNILDGVRNIGSGIDGGPALYNNLIQGNQIIGAPAFDLDTEGTTLKSASNNFITTISPNAVSTATNIIGNSQPQLGDIVGLPNYGALGGGPIYYPLLPGTVSVGYGSTSVLNTIAAVEGTTTANATDEIGNLLSTNAMRSGSLDLGTVQSVPTSPPSSSPPAPPPPLSLFQEIVTSVIDIDALAYRDSPLALSILNSLSQHLLGHPLPAANDLIPDLEAALGEVIHLILSGMHT